MKPHTPPHTRTHTCDSVGVLSWIQLDVMMKVMMEPEGHQGAELTLYLASELVLMAMRARWQTGLL